MNAHTHFSAVFAAREGEFKNLGIEVSDAVPRGDRSCY